MANSCGTCRFLYRRLDSGKEFDLGKLGCWHSKNVTMEVAQLRWYTNAAEGCQYWEPNLRTRVLK